METWHQQIQKNPHHPKWPYPVRYGEETEINADVLVIGGGIAGSHAAINAARKGAKVVVAEKGMAKRSGAGGAGVDHWLGCCTNPCSLVTPGDYVDACIAAAGGYTCGHARYIDATESWNTLLDCERMGMRIRDIDDEFKGADFRDEATKLMFAYDYTNRHHIRVYGYNVKPALYKEMKRCGVAIHNRVMVTSLLTEGGHQGARVVGATGISARTGEFYVFKAKVTVLATAGATIGVNRLWLLAPELVGSGAMAELNNACVGQAIGWNAGAEFALMEQTPSPISGLGYAPYSTGNAGNTYYGAPIVDADGKQVPWVDDQGREIETLEQRFRPGGKQKFFLGEGIGILNPRVPGANRLTPDLGARIAKGEFKLPLYADLTQLPETERRIIFGMMVGNEGKTRIPIYETFTRAGFDPDTDMMQVPVMSPDSYRGASFWGGRSFSHLRGVVGGGFLVDWDLKTSLDGLFAAGKCIFGSGNHGFAATTGGYAGRRAAAFAMATPSPILSKKQVAAEKKRVYAPLNRKNGNIGWKEFNAGIARIMQDYCSQHMNKNTLELGIRLLNDLEDSEGLRTYAANPHELTRLLECFSLISTGELVMQASLAREASSAYLSFNRLDHPQIDPENWRKFLPIRLEDNAVKVRELPLDYYLKPPYAPTFEENYRSRAD